MLHPDNGNQVLTLSLLDPNRNKLYEGSVPMVCHVNAEDALVAVSTSKRAQEYGNVLFSVLTMIQCRRSRLCM